MTDAAAFGIEAEPEETDEDAPEPVEVLVNLAEKGEIDPWDIDIIQVTDAFLAAIDEAEIRTSGRALFYASVLLRMKSDELFAEDEDPEPEEPERVDPFAAEPGLEGGGPSGVGDPIDQLEAEMDRRLDRQSARGTPETLDELVRELREAERGSWWKSGRSYDTENSPKGVPARRPDPGLSLRRHDPGGGRTRGVSRHRDRPRRGHRRTHRGRRGRTRRALRPRAAGGALRRDRRRRRLPRGDVPRAALPGSPRDGLPRSGRTLRRPLDPGPARGGVRCSRRGDRKGGRGNGTVRRRPVNGCGRGIVTGNPRPAGRRTPTSPPGCGRDRC